VDTLSVASLEAQALACATHQTGQSGGAAAVDQNGDYRVEPDKIARAILEQQPALADLVHPSLTH